MGFGARGLLAAKSERTVDLALLGLGLQLFGKKQRSHLQRMLPMNNKVMLAMAQAIIVCPHALPTSAVKNDLRIGPVNPFPLG